MGRVTAISDVFDALMSERPQKSAWPVEDAVAEIHRQGGRQFEPRLVQTFCSVLPALLEIKQPYTGPRTAASITPRQLLAEEPVPILADQALCNIPRGCVRRGAGLLGARPPDSRRRLKTQPPDSAGRQPRGDHKS